MRIIKSSLLGLSLFLCQLLVYPSAISAQTSVTEFSDRFCEGASTSQWSLLSKFSDQYEVNLVDALRDVECHLSRGNSDSYIGNPWHASIRLSPHTHDFTINVIRSLLRDPLVGNGREIFIGLVRGEGVEHDIFHQIQDTWTNTPGRRKNAMFTARAICMSIDRYDITELADIRSNECNTPPFVEPWRLP